MYPGEVPGHGGVPPRAVCIRVGGRVGVHAGARARRGRRAQAGRRPRDAARAAQGHRTGWCHSS